MPVAILAQVASAGCHSVHGHSVHARAMATPCTHVEWVAKKAEEGRQAEAARKADETKKLEEAREAAKSYLAAVCARRAVERRTKALEEAKQRCLMRFLRRQAEKARYIMMTDEAKKLTDLDRIAEEHALLFDRYK